MSRPLPSPASEVKKQTAAHSLANLFTAEGGDNGPGSFENDIVAELMAGGEEPATKKAKTEVKVEVGVGGEAGAEAAPAATAPPSLSIPESTPRRVAGASVLASLGGGVPALPPVAVADADGNAMQHDYLLQNLVHVSIRICRPSLLFIMVCMEVSILTFAMFFSFDVRFPPKTKCPSP